MRHPVMLSWSQTTPMIPMMSRVGSSYTLIYYYLQLFTFVFLENDMEFISEFDQ